MENCLVLIKPDGLMKGVTGDVLSHLSFANLKIIAMKVTRVSKEVAQEHYIEHKDKPFYSELVNFIMGKSHVDRVIAIIYHGEDAVKKIRTLAGATHPEKAEPGTIRAKYGRINSQTKNIENVMHASDSPKSAEREIKLWFSPEEITQDIYPVKTEKKEIEVKSWA
jgi:nucleoside-diphosphate kinase